jgi:hypothetical protein
MTQICIDALALQTAYVRVKPVCWSENGFSIESSE